MLLRQTSLCLVLAMVAPLVGATMASVPAAATDASETAPSPSSPAVSAQVPRAWLSGPFGRVLGGDPAHPAGTPPDGAPLDLWMRGAPLVLEIEGDEEGEIAVTVEAVALPGDGPPVTLSEGPLRFSGPDTAGPVVVTATLAGEASGSSRHAWLLDVPDRVGGEEVLLQMPGPTALVDSSGGSTAGEPGHGCYVYLCVDVGYRPPADALPVVPVGIGETLSLRLDDGSALSGWTGTITPLPGTYGRPREADETFVDGPRSVADLVGLEPTEAGEWWLELRADFDRERGWQWFAYRLMAR